MPGLLLWSQEEACTEIAHKLLVVGIVLICSQMPVENVIADASLPTADGQARVLVLYNLIKKRANLFVNRFISPILSASLRHDIWNVAPSRQICWPLCWCRLRSLNSWPLERYMSIPPSCWLLWNLLIPTNILRPTNAVWILGSSIVSGVVPITCKPVCILRVLFPFFLKVFVFIYQVIFLLRTCCQIFPLLLLAHSSFSQMHLVLFEFVDTYGNSTIAELLVHHVVRWIWLLYNATVLHLC